MHLINFLLIHISREAHISTKCTYQSNAHDKSNENITKKLCFRNLKFVRTAPCRFRRQLWHLRIRSWVWYWHSQMLSCIFFKEGISSYIHNLITFPWHYCEAKKLISLRKAHPFKEAQHAANSFWTSCHTCNCSKNANRLLKKSAQGTSW